jgi:tetratricopeptide (TPR) repeat protein
MSSRHARCLAIDQGPAPLSESATRAALRVFADATAVLAIVSTVLAAAPTPVRAQGSAAGKPPQQVQHADFVGAPVCGQCHAAELKAWSASHHQAAMLEATVESVLGDFSDARLAHHGMESSFFRRDGKFVVRTDGPDGKPADYEIAYTFGVWPLQQYLVAFPGGRLQVLPLAWDARPQPQGGQRWFHLNADRQIAGTDQLHWTGIYQNWNMQCAECHSTNLRKNYSPATSSYSTTFTESNVACESCHGAGARHVAWAKESKSPADRNKGLVISLKSRWQEAWQFPNTDAKTAQRDNPAPPSLMNVCGNCHSRRSTILEQAPSGEALENTHLPSLPAPPNYFADGQQNQEVYVWESFRQSRMHQRGVTCMDCHEPHTLKLRVEGNSLCGHCHNAETFDSRKHHNHAPQSAGAQCGNCHMPERDYMTVDARRDHFIRVPRPDISAAVSSPDACTSCHKGKVQQWAAEAMDGWYGKAWRDRPTDALALHAGAVHGAKALPELLAIAKDRTRPANVRAAALSLAQEHAQRESYADLPGYLSDPDPLVRIAALGWASRLAPQQRLGIAGRLLGDETRAVRITAASALTGVPDTMFPEALRGSRVQALRDYANSLALNEDWPATNVERGNVLASRGQLPDARKAYERAIILDPLFVAGYVNLADFERQAGNEPAAEAVLRRGIAVLPREADLRHALGLTLIRRGARDQALTELAAAAETAADNARYAYVFAVALQSVGRRDDALNILESFDARQPDDVEVLNALVSFNREAGRREQALKFARRLKAVLPNEPSLDRLLRELERP